MKRVDRLLIQLAIIHFIFLLTAQTLNQTEGFRRLTNKSIQFEGVIKGGVPETLETIDRN
ncbi:DUF5359 family protein [Fictibacillus aquaticus]|uniref:Uncharacterized protein n=1 Tax=Fictibacillus aquaticus TaxID=2021314 RepID=A0A235FAZ8_9BACL|nr:DUF5359 family protein [Fictibacillus aquaticus]OYD58506.1 hypothetical protein CGZ90_00980 [Fictibacillus aquaticus]